MENNNRKSRVLNMNDYVNNNLGPADDALEPAENEGIFPDAPCEIPPLENKSGVIARTVYPSSHSVSASRYAGAACIPDSADEPGQAAYQEKLYKLQAEETAHRSQSHEASPKSSAHTEQRSVSAQPRRSLTVKPVSARSRVQSVAPQRETAQKTAPRRDDAAERSGNSQSRPGSLRNTEAAPKKNTRTTAANRKYSDIVDERRSRHIVEETEYQPEQKRHIFRTLMIIYSVLLFVVIAAGLVFLYIYLGKFEQSQPNKVAESVAANYATSARLTSFIKANADKIDCIDNLDDFTEAYTQYIEGRKVSYVEKSSSTAEVPAYNLVMDGTIVGTFTLRQNGTGDFNTALWELDTYDIVSSFPLGYNLTIIVPEGSSVQVNDTILGADYISASSAPAVLENAIPFLGSVPLFDTYTVPILTPEPNVIAKDKTGASLIFSVSRADKDITFISGTEAEQEFVDSVDPLVKQAIEVWGLYFINMDDTLDSYIKQGTGLYADIFGSEDMDPILTWLYNFEQIDSYDFEYIRADNYQRYSEDCFTVDISYKLNITFTEEDMTDDNQNLDATWVWVPDGDSWSIADLIYK